MRSIASIVFTLIFAFSVFGQTSLPMPELVFTGKQEINTNGFEQTIYRLGVIDRSEYPNEMFEASPNLPACGRNSNSSRSRVDIFSLSGKRIYDFCALKSADELNSLAFLLPKNTRLNGVYIIIKDRKSVTEYKSNSVELK